MVLDPFMGSGTTNFVAQRMHRNSIGIELLTEHHQMVKEKIEPVKLILFEPEEEYEPPKLNGRQAVVESYSRVINRFTKEFANEFCNDSGEINWNKLVEFNSGKKKL